MADESWATRRWCPAVGVSLLHGRGNRVDRLVEEVSEPVRIAEAADAVGEVAGQLSQLVDRGGVEGVSLLRVDREDTGGVPGQGERQPDD